MQLMVIQDSDNLKIGEIAASKGMELANGYKVVKVNDKSAIAVSRGRHTEKFFDPTSIFYTEAIAWRFPENHSVNRQAEELAATLRKFERGEQAYKQHHEHEYILPLCDLIEQAGYDFAKKVQVQRESTIRELLEAKEASSSTPAL
jgi:hypothetical protein